MTMVEKVARAEHDWDQEDRRRLGGYIPETFDELSDVIKKMRFDRARVAIIAMRDPTPKMDAAGEAAVNSSDPNQEWISARTLGEAYHAMINAALAEER